MFKYTDLDAVADQSTNLILDVAGLRTGTTLKELSIAMWIIPMA